MSDETTVDVGGEEVRISSPGRVIFPKQGWTKLDVANHFSLVAEGALLAVYRFGVFVAVPGVDRNVMSQLVSQQTGGLPKALDPMAVSGILVSMLAHTAAHQYGFEFWGIRTDDVQKSMARIIYWTITNQKPPTS